MNENTDVLIIGNCKVVSERGQGAQKKGMKGFRGLRDLGIKGLRG